MSKDNIAFTTEQQNAIDLVGKDILVSAAAGSGKTAVLVARIIGRILHKENPVDIDKMLVVTYTNAAANEMKKRILSALEARMENEPNNKQIRRQLTLLSRAQISTMSAFCLSLAKEYFYTIDMDPNFRPADTTETAILQGEVLEDFFEDLYKQKTPYFLRLLSYFESGVGDEQLRKALIEGNSHMRRHPWPVLWLEEQESVLDIENEEDLYTSSFFQFLLEEMQSDLENLVKQSQALVNEVNNLSFPEKFIEVITSDLESLQLLLSQMTSLTTPSQLDTFIHQYSLLRYNTLRRFKPTTDREEKAQENIIITRNQLKDQAYKLRSVFSSDTQHMIEHLQIAKEYMTDFHLLLLEFENAYAATKRAHLIADFSDLEHFALGILLKPGSTTTHLQPTKEALVIRSQFEEIYIDEYQDINMLQELILLTISGKSDNQPNRFMVGDIKQSIYRFRLANPDIFSEKYRNYPLLPSLASCHTKISDSFTIELSKNFRSRQEVLAAINDIFVQVMSPTVGEVAYTKKVALYPGKPYTPIQTPMASLHLIVQKDDDTDFLKEFSKNQMEAAFIATQIETFIATKYMVEENDQLRSIEYRDMVVLMRSPKQRADLIEQELSNRNIPAYNHNAEGYFEKTEVMTILSLLSVIDNPRQDIALVSLLYSPIFFIDPDELFTIAQMKAGSFYDSILAYMAKHPETDLFLSLDSIMKQIKKYANKALHMPIHRLLWFLFEDTGYYDLVGSLPGGALRQGNLLSLFEQALLFEESNNTGLFHFVSFIETLQQEDRDMAEAKIVSESENVVRLMSIHKSKGLEFPVVFLANTEKRFFLPETTGPVISHPHFGFGFKAYDEEKRVFTDTIHRKAIKEKLRLEAISEELRVLYVALTRAREKLILTGSMENLDKIINKNAYIAGETAISLPTNITKHGNSFLDFVLWALIRHPDGGILVDEPISSLPFQSTWKIEVVMPQDIYLTGYDNKRYESQFIELLQKGATIEGNPLLSKRLHFVYPRINATLTPSTLSISEINRRFTEILLPKSTDLFLLQKKYDLSKPTWDTTKASAQSKGTLVHTILEHVDYTQRDKDYLASLVESLVAKNILHDDDIADIPLNEIEIYLQSPLAKRIENASHLYREWPFVMELPPNMLEAFTEKGILLRGIIDLAFVENNQLVLVDYKTDKIYPDIATIADRHRYQLSIYAHALEESLGMKVTESILYLFDIQETIIMDLVSW